MLKKINNKTKEMNTSFKVALIYFVVGVFWMLFSGKLLELLLYDNALIERVKTFENIIFITLTSVMIYFLVFKFNEEQKEVLEKLESSEVTKKTFIESLPFAIFEKDSNFIYRSANEYYKEYAKMIDEQIIGKSDYEIFDQDIAESYRKEDEKIIKDKKTITYSEDIVSKDSNKIYNVVKTPFFEKGEFKGIIGVIIDITETRRKEEEFSKLYLAIEKSTNAILITKLNGDIEYVNKAYENISGYTRKELLGENIKKYRAGYHPDEFYSEMWNTVQSGGTWKGEVRNSRKDGTLYWERNYIMPVTDEKNTIKSVIAFKEDVSHEKETEVIVNELEKFREKVIDNNEIWISATDENDYVVLWNPACERLTGYSEEEVVGKKSIREKLANDSNGSNGFNDIISSNNLSETNLTAKIGIKTKSGEKKYISISAKKIFLESSGTNINLFMGVDVTKEVLAELKLKTMNIELEERVRLRTEELFNTNEFLEQSMGELEEQQAELTTLNDQLETSLEELQNTQQQLIMSEKLAALGELVAGVAHEINTPLGIGVTLSTFIKEKHRDLKEAFLKNELKRTTMKEYVDSIDEAVELMVINLYRASELVTSFKQVATDQSTLEIRKFNVNSYINEVLLSLYPRMKKTTHKFEVLCDKEFEMIGHPGAMSQIITNLVMNSLIHGFENKENGLMKLEISVVKDIMHFKYTDNGIGVKEEDLENIFKPFFTTKRNSGSTGLGMHIIHNIVVQILNGKIDFKSKVDNGVEVIIEFPLLKFEEIHK